jgi:hypothetical protein
MRLIACAAWGLVLGLTAGTATADVLHDESVNGDLSGDRSVPTAYVLSQGTNSVIATSVSGDIEYIALTVPAGLQMQRLVLASYTGLDETAFIGVQSGPVFTEPPTGTNVANLLGWTHFGPALGHVGTDILDDLGAGPGSIGFTPPLGAGVYTFWIQQTGQNAATYQLDYSVVPGPGALTALMAGVGLVARRRRK